MISYSWGGVIDQDLNDADKKIGKKTLYETVSIIGSWGGGFAGAKAGAVAGAGIGTAILPGLGTAIGGTIGAVVLGITGSYGGDKIADYVIDITEVEK